MDLPPWRTVRKLTVLAIALLVVPTVVSGAAHVATGGSGESVANGTDSHPVDDLAIVTAQGREPHVTSSPGGIEIVNTTTNEVVWSHDRPECMRYFDAEPIDNSTLFITANCELADGERLRLGLEHDWRNDTTERVFSIPWDTHDVDRLGPHRYAIADIQRQKAYVYNYTAGETTEGTTFDGRTVADGRNGEHEWTWNFTDHYPESHGGETGYADDYTHLNDVDSIYDDSAFLLSPRDFNRVVAVDRETDEVLWTLGEQNDTSILYEQHQPTLIETDPTTVLVGDSLNHRAIEYRYVVDGEPADARETAGGTWEPTWVYNDDLNWPRAVDRLPNGNTLIADTGNHRVIEVSPNGTVVWEYETESNPYEVDRYVHGNEPQGPPMATFEEDVDAVEGKTTSVGTVSPLDEFHRYAGFVLPPWVGEWAFLGLALATILTVALLAVETGRALRRRL